MSDGRKLLDVEVARVMFNVNKAGEVRSVTLRCRDCSWSLCWPVQSFATVPPAGAWRKLFDHVATHPERSGNIEP